MEILQAYIVINATTTTQNTPRERMLTLTNLLLVNRWKKYKMTQDDGNRTCTVCDGPFDIIGEGGIDGYIGILSVAFCPTCYAGIVDMVQQLHGLDDDE